MNKPIGDEPVILIFLRNGARIKDQIVHNFMGTKCKNGNDNSNDDDNKRNRHLYVLKASNLLKN